MRRSILIYILCSVFCIPTFAQDSVKVAKKAAVKSHLQQHFKVYGFIRNYFTYDSRESISGTGDLYNYQPKDVNLNEYGQDLNAQSTFRFLALTTRVGVNITGYTWRNIEFGGKIEADFYAGLNKVGTQTHSLSGTAQLRLRQAYMTMAWDSLPMNKKDYARVELTIGQTWHPMAADLCDAIALNSGAPFGPFNRSPQVRMDARLGQYVTLTAAMLWQMQYNSTGPEGQSAEYIAYSKVPEAYMGLSFHHKGFLMRAGADVLSIKPRHLGTVDDPDFGKVTVKVGDRITTASPFLYLQYKKGEFSIKAKTIFAEAGEHMNLNGGYGISYVNTTTGEYSYTPMRNSSTWVSLVYGGKVGAQETKHPQKLQGILFAGYVHNLGTKDELAVDPQTGKIVGLYIPRTTNMRQMYRITPALLWTIGKFQIGCEYSITAVQYGDLDAAIDVNKGINPANGLAENNRHWIGNHRVQLMTKFNF